ncbi:hypothetical protein [Flavobacterium sharifuzzamanii]|uniref:hypothetical protein n=2 Tax=Flavobacterium sharifuzzamanii TaxID=2211133 RepID=UPI001EEFA645|nr:hypothetical protein [Flavobacterium sharifuzzamanii]
MRKIFLLIIVFFSKINYAQNTYPFPENGKVGIGTTNPLSKLDVIGTAMFRETNSSYYSELSSDANNAYLRSYGVAKSLLIYDILGKPVVMQPYSGNVGIGTTNPLSKLDVIGTAMFRETNSSYYSELSSDANNAYLRSYGVAKSLLIYDILGKPVVMQPYSGNVGIGVTNPTNKLDVKGTIHSQEVKVDMTGWSDFVFKKEYNLPTLEEVEKHIAEKGHLENIPSEKEVLENGINLGEMNAKFLQKIEELTLYIIQQNKKNNTQYDQITSLKDQVDSLKKQNETLSLILERLSKLEHKLN